MERENVFNVYEKKKYYTKDTSTCMALVSGVQTLGTSVIREKHFQVLELKKTKNKKTFFLFNVVTTFGVGVRVE
jgi:hypothetical protein